MNMVEEFLKAKRENLASDLTIKNYKIDLIQFLPIVFEKELDKVQSEDLKDLTILKTREALLKLQAENNYTVTTLNRRLASFKSFCKYWCGVYNISNPLHNMKKFNDTRIHEVEFISNEDAKKIVQKAKNTSSEMYLIMGMLFNTGLRSAELLSLTAENVHEDCIVVIGKGNKLRKVELNSIAKDCLSRYITENDIKQGALLKIPYVTLRRRYTRFLAKCNIDCSRLHTTRKSFATNLIEKGASLTDVSSLLGHSSTSVLEKHYLGSSTKRITVSLLD